MDEILNKIKSDIDWYNEHCKDASIDNLMKLKSHIVTLNYNVAEHLTSLKKDYNVARYNKKIAFTRAKNELVRKGEKIGAAESEADEKTADEYKQELDIENLAYRLEMLLKQSNYVVDDISQRISVLKRERENSNIGT
jgi:hypothetical protein